jgi:hypothetical protein
MYLKAYELSAQGMSDTKIAKALGVGWDRFQNWLEDLPALREAIDRGRAGTKSPTSPPKGDWRGCGETLVDYCYRRLPPHLKELWEQIQLWSGVHPVKGTYSRRREDPDAYAKITALFDRPNMVRARQYLFIHACVASNFNMNEACRKLCVSYSVLRNWEKDEKFKELLLQLRDTMAHFAEAGAFRLVAAGDGAMTQFILRGLMPEKYNPKVLHKHEGEVNVLHGQADVDKILANMSAADKRKMLDSMRGAAQKALGPHVEVIDAEVTPRESQ